MKHRSLLGSSATDAARRRAAAFCGAMAVSFSLMSFAVWGQNALDEKERTNGAETLKAVSPAEAKAVASRVVLGETREKPAVTGVILSADGYILTKSSELAPLKTLRVWLPDGSSANARLARHDEKLDLALLKIPREGLSAVEWAPAPLMWKMGQWLCSAVHDGDGLRLGVVSARRRAISNSGAVMGIRFGPSEKDDVGVLIEEVAKEGPAQEAGLRAEDVLIQINGKNVNQPEAVRRMINKCRPGDVITVHYLRVGKEAECEVRLASRNQVMMHWTGGDFANHGTSLRTDNFPDVIQHEMPLSPEDMGGALFDLQGRAVGLNIARVDRVTNYALSSEVFLLDVTGWMQADRDKK